MEIATDTTTLRAADGHELAAYRVRPVSSAKAGLVVLQEIFGINGHIREVCEAYGRLGYLVVSPALFDRVERGVELGYDAQAIERGRALRAAIGWEASLLDVQAAINAAQDGGPVAVLGYCWGGTLAFLAATRLHGLTCAVGYYGGQSAPFAHEKARVPVLLHFGEFDPRVPKSDIEKIRLHNPQIEIHVFPADHGFNCDHRKEWHAPSAAKALTITLGFLRDHLSRPGRRPDRQKLGAVQPPDLLGRHT